MNEPKSWQVAHEICKAVDDYYKQVKREERFALIVSGSVSFILFLLIILLVFK